MKRGLPIEQHRAFGQRLSNLHRELTALSVEVGRAYPLESVVGRAAARLLDHNLDKLRSALDRACVEEHPAEFLPAIYYGEKSAAR